jgi:hypothetical protein
MSKKKTGYQPPKGKPSGAGKPEEPIISSVRNIEITDRYVQEPDEMLSTVHILHPNRNVDKEEYHRSRSRNMGTEKRLESMTGRDFSSVLVSELPLPFTKEAFSGLASFRADVCISVFMPTHASGAEVNERLDNRSFKNMLQSLQHELSARGIHQDRIDNMLAPGYALLLQDDLWRNLSAGLAVFISEEKCTYLRVPFTLEQDTMIQDSFCLAPLVPLLTSEHYFYLLVLSKKQAKLYRADAFGMRNVPVKEMPDGIDDVVHFEEKEGKNLWRTGGRGGKGGANFHGTGGGVPDEKTNIAMYLDEVDETLMKEGLADEHVPLLLAGVEYMLPIFRQVSTYKHIAEQALTGNYEIENMNSLYEAAMAVMRPHFEAETRKALDQYANQSATAFTSSVPADVISAAAYGRVAQLFVAEGFHLWGTHDETNDRVIVHEDREQDDECLLNKAVVNTYMTGGEVHFMKKEQMPADSIIAAVMRY